jgi:hypothetical protein
MQIMLEHVVAPSNRSPRSPQPPPQQRSATDPRPGAKRIFVPRAAHSIAAPPRPGRRTGESLWVAAPWAGGREFPALPAKRQARTSDTVIKSPPLRGEERGPGNPRPMSNAVLEKAKASQRRLDLQSLRDDRNAAAALAAEELADWRAKLSRGTAVTVGCTVSRVSEVSPDGALVRLAPSSSGEQPQGWVAVNVVKRPTAKEMELLGFEEQVREARLEEQKLLLEAEAAAAAKAQEEARRAAQADAEPVGAAPSVAAAAAAEAAAEADRRRIVAHHASLQATAEATARRDAVERAARAAAKAATMDPLRSASWNYLEHTTTMELSGSSAWRLKELIEWRGRLAADSLAMLQGKTRRITDVAATAGRKHARLSYASGELAMRGAAVPLESLTPPSAWKSQRFEAELVRIKRAQAKAAAAKARAEEEAEARHAAEESKAACAAEEAAQRQEAEQAKSTRAMLGEVARELVDTLIDNAASL